MGLHWSSRLLIVFLLQQSVRPQLGCMLGKDGDGCMHVSGVEASSEGIQMKVFCHRIILSFEDNKSNPGTKPPRTIMIPWSACSKVYVSARARSCLV